MQSIEGVPSAAFGQDPRSAIQETFLTYFPTACSVCGRQLRILVEHLGQHSACGRCGGQSIAANPRSSALVDLSAQDKADQLLRHPWRCAMPPKAAARARLSLMKQALSWPFWT